MGRRHIAVLQERWRAGDRPDLEAALSETATLIRSKSLLIELAHEEYVRRVAAGESPDPAEFAERFPSLKSSLYLYIAVKELFSQDPGFAASEAGVVWPVPGEDFLGFRLIEELGRGAFARVFLASEPALGGRLVAVKVALQGGREAEMLGRLPHPNIVPVFSVREDSDEGLTAICMPYLGRATLADVRDHAFASNGPPVRATAILEAVGRVGDEFGPANPPPPDRILRRGSYVEGVVHVGAQIAEALSYAHSRGVLHRDLKPSNVLLGADAGALLLDFNLSCESGVAGPGAGGTLPYMAPEQLRTVVDPTHPADELGPRADLFALGVILYELFTGVLPFGFPEREASVTATAQRLLERQQRGAPPLVEENPQVGRRLAATIHRCLMFDPDRRPASAEALAAELRQELSPRRRSVRWVKTHPRLSLAVSTALLAVVLAVAGFLALRPPYSVRQFHRGRQYVEQGDYHLAIPCFNACLETDKNNANALFYRGLAHQRMGEYQVAFDDYRAADRVLPHARNAIGKGYCLAKLNFYEAAIDSFRIAVARGDASAVVLNNIGFGYLQLGRWDEAEQYLNRALAKDECLQAAHYSLLAVYLNRALSEGAAVPPEVIHPVKRAIEMVPPSALLYRRAATLCVLAARQDSALLGVAASYVQEGIVHGLDPASLESDPVLSSLLNRPELQNLPRSAVHHASGAEPDFLVDPL